MLCILGGGCPMVASAIFGNQSLMGRNLNLCFICKVFWYSVDIVHADVVMERLHLKTFRGSCSIGFCRFSMTQISSLLRCCCLLTEKCIFSQREDKIMHFVFYTVKLIFYNINQVIYNNLWLGRTTRYLFIWIYNSPIELVACIAFLQQL